MRIALSRINRVTSIAVVLVAGLVLGTQRAEAASDAEQPKVDPAAVVGVWDHVSSTEIREYPATLVITSQNGVLAATFVTHPQLGLGFVAWGETVEATDVSFDGTMLRWSMVIPALQPDPLEAAVTVSANTYEGTISSAVLGDFPVTGTRRAAEESGRFNPPSILFILTDDQGWSQVSRPMDPDIPSSRSTYLDTPNMDRLADGGMRFTDGYAPAPNCTPTRRSILCGTTAPRSGSVFVSSWVPSEHVTIPKALKAVNQSYRCAHFGKWGEVMISSPEDCGYDASDGKTANVTGGFVDALKDFHIVEDPKRTQTVTRRAIGFMREQARAGRPFYVQVSYYAPHIRVELLETTLRRYQLKGEPDRGYSPAWAAMLDELDTGIGELLDELDRLGIADETYVFLMSDNGGRKEIPGGDRSRLPTNYPLSGAKLSLFEGGIRVPFLVRGPGIAANSVCHVPVTGYDLLPTFVELAGGHGPLPGGIDGGSITPLFADPEGGSVSRPLDALFFHAPPMSMSAIRQGDYKLLIRWSRQGEILERRLHDLRADYSETENLVESRPGKADAMQETLFKYLRDVDVEIP